MRIGPAGPAGTAVLALALALAACGDGDGGDGGQEAPQTGELVIWSDTSGLDGFQAFIDGRSAALVRETGELGYEVPEGTSVSGEFEAMAWPGFAIAGTSCEPGQIIHSFTVGLGASHLADDAESVETFAALIQPFMAAAVDASVCSPGDNPASGYAPDRGTG